MFSLHEVTWNYAYSPFKSKRFNFISVLIESGSREDFLRSVDGERDGEEEEMEVDEERFIPPRLKISSQEQDTNIRHFPPGGGGVLLLGYTFSVLFCRYGTEKTIKNNQFLTINNHSLLDKL